MEDCSDADTILRWLSRAATAAKVEDIFIDD
jgi:hypothetical protein